MGTELCGYFLGLGRIGIDDPDKFHGRQVGVFFGMKFTQITNSDHTDTDFFHGDDALNKVSGVRFRVSGQIGSFRVE